MKGRSDARAARRLRRPVLKLSLFLACCVLPIAGALHAVPGSRVPWPLVAYALASVLGYGVVRLDKSRASNGRRRIPERTLHLAELLGGWPGSMWAQQLARHKTRKVSYQIVFWLAVLVHQVLWGAWLWHVRAWS